MVRGSLGRSVEHELAAIIPPELRDDVDAERARG
jgi:hypothetical protein